MKIHVVTKDQLNDKNKYIGLVDLTDFDGAIEIESNLGIVKFDSIKALFYIFAKTGSGIKAGDFDHMLHIASLYCKADPWKAAEMAIIMHDIARMSLKIIANDLDEASRQKALDYTPINQA